LDQTGNWNDFIKKKKASEKEAQLVKQGKQGGVPQKKTPAIDANKKIA
jgi:hypothetical protein